MRILYLTWGEVPRLSSVYGGQVVNVINELQQRPEVEDARLLAGVPIIHSGLFREKWHYGKLPQLIRKMIGADNFHWRSIPVPPVEVHPKRSQLPFFLNGQTGYLARQIRKYRSDIVQCRSYVATVLAHAARDRFNMGFKIIFDSRSYMPDEALITGR